MLARAVICGLVVAAASAPLSGQPDAQALLARAGAYVGRYYSRAQSVLAQETVVVQPIARDLSPEGFARRLVYEVRLDWNPAPDDGVPAATVVRELVSATGPVLGPRDQECLAPAPISPEPLTFLLPAQQSQYAFVARGIDRVGGRQALSFDYTARTPEPVSAEWKGECGRVNLSGRTRGRVWIDLESAEVLRLDERLMGPVDIPGPPERRRATRFFVYERADSTIAYGRVSFSNPDEALMLPTRIDTVSVVQGASRVRITQVMANYRRFLTESRLVR